MAGGPCSNQAWIQEVTVGMEEVDGYKNQQDSISIKEKNYCYSSGFNLEKGMPTTDREPRRGALWGAAIMWRHLDKWRVQ